MTNTVHVNGDRLRSRLLELRLSDRDFGRTTGIGQGVTRSMILRNEINGSTPIADIARCLRETGMTAADLLDSEPAQAPDEDPITDVQTLAHILNAQKRMHPLERLATALNWDMDRLRAAITRLHAHLAPLGLAIHENKMGVTIRAVDSRADEALNRLDGYRDADEGLHHGAARILYAVFTGSLSNRETKNDHMVQLGALRNRDAIQFGDGTGQRFILTERAAFAFDVPGTPTGQPKA